MASNKFTVLLLVVGLVVGFAFGSLSQSGWQTMYNQLYKDYENLQIQYTTLNSTYWELKQTVVEKAFLLEDSEYYVEAYKLIKNATDMVYVIMFVVKFDPKHAEDPVNRLLKALVDAKNRGVEVKVLVDDETLKSYPQTLTFLETNNVKVKLDPSSGVQTHTKMVVVDGKYVLVGSHNWTESALSYNHEVSLEIVSEGIAQEAVGYFNSLWENGRTLST